ncbi:MAG: recombinase family protein [Acidobacteria bacterium]|nr:recombinase family protein [Acidobacteriota bacterium]
MHAQKRSTPLLLDTAGTYDSCAQDARGRDGMMNPEDAMREDAPTYTDANQGTDQDQDMRAATTLERSARRARNTGDRQGLVAQLNAHGSSLSNMVGYLRGKPSRRSESTTSSIPRIVIYLRVSTEEQAKVGGEAEGYSIPYQRDACLGKIRQLGGILVCEYVDAGESAKSARRPDLQKMLRELKAKRIDYVVVHKIDRLARNRADDVAINAAIAKSGAKLISVAEPVDETPAGKLLYNMMADVAQYHSDNLALEVLKGMDTKAKRGGTPYRAPLGYLNHREFIDDMELRTVIIDEDRAPLIRWAFEQYALGDWAIRQLVDALNAQGLRTRYYTCLSRRTGRRPCTRRPMRLEKIEDGTEAFFGTFQLRPELAEKIHAGVIEELSADREQATQATARATKRIAKLKTEREKLLTAHYAGAVPLDMLKAEMDRLTGEITDAEGAITAAKRAVTDLEGTLEAALTIAGRCHQHYLGAEPRVRRMINQGLFRALYISQDCGVERFELTEPFATLLDRHLLTDLAEERTSGRRQPAEPVITNGHGRPEDGAESRERPSAVLVRTFACAKRDKTNKPDGGAVRLGLHKIVLVPPAGFEPAHPPPEERSLPAASSGVTREDAC